MTDRNEALRLADSVHEMNSAAYMTAIANLNEKNRQQAERIAELETELTKRHKRLHDTEELAGHYLVQRDDATAERDQLRAEVERYHHLRNGQSWPAVFTSHDAPEPLRGATLRAAIDNARTTHKDEG